jgi:lipoic acid synthetase
MRLAQTLAEMSLEYAVITTVCRDDLPDQGAGHLSECIREVKRQAPGLLLEILLQDFRGDPKPLETVLSAEPNVAAHNLETVERLTALVRDAKAGYRQSLEVLKACRKFAPRMPTKSSLMLGLGETEVELLETFRHLREAGVEILTLGQYLRPTRLARHLPVKEYLAPERFESYGEMARGLGFLYVASGPLVRSSYRAGELFLKGMLERNHAYPGR